MTKGITLLRRLGDNSVKPIISTMNTSLPFLPDLNEFASFVFLNVMYSDQIAKGALLSERLNLIRFLTI
ncbi:conserved hypothetical protein [Vibrio chagasii]|nr:conserved hypothetical protein [Vibrio chagasii]